MPSREMCTVKRSRTNTPLQALALLNDVTYVEASRGLATSMLEAAEGDIDRAITHGFRRATSRDPSSDELAVLRAGHERRLTHYQTHSEAAKALIQQGESKPSDAWEPARLAAMTTTASILLNLDETITKE